MEWFWAPGLKCLRHGELSPMIFSTFYLFLQSYHQTSFSNQLQWGTLECCTELNLVKKITWLVIWNINEHSLFFSLSVVSCTYFYSLSEKQKEMFSGNVPDCFCRIQNELYFCTINLHITVCNQITFYHISFN